MAEGGCCCHVVGDWAKRDGLLSCVGYDAYSGISQAIAGDIGDRDLGVNNERCRMSGENVVYIG